MYASFREANEFCKMGNKKVRRRRLEEEEEENEEEYMTFMSEFR